MADNSKDRTTQDQSSKLFLNSTEEMLIFL